jgi:long-chain acyl-CoA synthetase
MRQEHAGEELSGPGTPHLMGIPGLVCGERTLSRDQLFERANRLAKAISQFGVTKGDSVALLLRNDIAFFEATLAARALGAYAVPINWHAKPDEVSYVLGDCQAKVLIAHSDLLRDLQDLIDQEHLTVVATPPPPEHRKVFSIPEALSEVPTWAISLQELIAHHEPLDERQRAAPASMIYTSGTTGRPKGVQRPPVSPEQAKAIAQVNDAIFDLHPGVRTVIPAPLYHTAPNGYGLSAVLVGATVILMPRFDPLELLTTIQAEAIDHIQVVPTMLVRLLRLPRELRESFDLSSLQHLVHAAAPCPIEVKRATIEWLGPIVYEYYGCTESGAITACNSHEWLEHPGTVGKPLPGAKVVIVDEKGNELPPGRPGDIYLYHPAFGSFRYAGASGTSEIATEAGSQQGTTKGMITCGDIGYLDQDGYLYLCDRRKDMVISGGVNLYPAEIEAVLLGIEGVEDAAVFGIPDEDLGEVLAAAVQLSPDARLTPAMIQELLRDRLGKLKIPRVIEIHERLPREDSGKIFKRLLKAPYWEGHRGSDLSTSPTLHRAPNGT